MRSYTDICHLKKVLYSSLLFLIFTVSCRFRDETMFGVARNSFLPSARKTKMYSLHILPRSRDVFASADTSRLKTCSWRLMHLRFSYKRRKRSPLIHEGFYAAPKIILPRDLRNMQPTLPNGIF